MKAGIYSINSKYFFYVDCNLHFGNLCRPQVHQWLKSKVGVSVSEVIEELHRIISDKRQGGVGVDTEDNCKDSGEPKMRTSSDHEAGQDFECISSGA
jgi:hypothetical protein